MISMFERNGGYIFQTDIPDIYKKLKNNCKQVTYCRDELYYNGFLYNGVLPQARNYLKNLSGGPVTSRNGTWTVEQGET